MNGILFFIYLFIEVVITLSLASAIGILYTFLEIVLSAAIGLLVLLNTPQKISESFQRILNNQITITAVGLAGTLRILAAFLLILPGFFCDTVAILLLLWSAVLLIGSSVSAYVKAPKKTNDIDDKDVIDVEIIDDHSDK